MLMNFPTNAPDAIYYIGLYVSQGNCDWSIAHAQACGGSPFQEVILRAILTSPNENPTDYELEVDGVYSSFILTWVGWRREQADKVGQSR